MRQVVLDTETTGLEPSEGHRIIEIGCVELVNRRITARHYHQYLFADRDIDEGALEVHGITREFLKGCPRFAAIVEDFLDFIRGAELVIHNAAFDVGFINHELSLVDPALGTVADYCTVLDSLALARELHPGQKNSLDALCNRYGLDNAKRELHGALLDAGLLAEVYLAMTGGQASLSFDMAGGYRRNQTAASKLLADRPPLTVIQPSEHELEAHHQRLMAIDEVSGGHCVWKKLGGEEISDCPPTTEAKRRY